MKKAVFTKKWFYWLIIVFYLTIMAFRIINIVNTQYVDIFQILFSLTVVWAIVTKNKYSKILIQGYGGLISAIMLILLITNFGLKTNESNKDNFYGLNSFWFYVISFVFGLFIIAMATRTIQIKVVEDKTADNKAG